MEKDKSGGNETPYRGVRKLLSGKFGAEINDKSRKTGRVWLGTFNTAEEAAHAYDQAAYSVHGSHAIVNFPDELHLYAVNASASSSINETKKEAIEFEYLCYKILEDMLDSPEEENKRK